MIVSPRRGRVEPGGEDHVKPGDKVGRYRLGEQIGEGAMAQVFASSHPVFERTLAIKVLKKEACWDASFVARFLGRRLDYTYEVRELVPGERFVMSTAEGPFPMETTYGFEDAPVGGTRMTLRNRGEPAGFAKVAAPVMARAIRRANGQDLRRLKEILEASRGGE
jgi:hypothetical protein